MIRMNADQAQALAELIWGEGGFASPILRSGKVLMCMVGTAHGAIYNVNAKPDIQGRGRTFEEAFRMAGYTSLPTPRAQAQDGAR